MIVTTLLYIEIQRNMCYLKRIKKKKSGKSKNPMSKLPKIQNNNNNNKMIQSQKLLKNKMTT